MTITINNKKVKMRKLCRKPCRKPSAKNKKSPYVWGSFSLKDKPSAKRTGVKAWTIRYTGGYGTFVLRRSDGLEMYLDAPWRSDSEELATSFLKAISAKKVKVITPLGGRKAKKV